MQTPLIAKIGRFERVPVTLGGLASILDVDRRDLVAHHLLAR